MNFLKTCTALALVLSLASCGGNQNSEGDADSTMMATTETVEMPTIVGVASANENFSTLVTAVTAADLAGTLDGAGPFTVFAPTNDAFAKLPAGTVDDLLKPENKEKLSSILTYHVVSGNIDAATVIEAINTNNGKYSVATVQGENLDFSLKDGSVMLTDANGGTALVVIPDVAASNGVIHAIDTVVMPK